MVTEVLGLMKGAGITLVIIHKSHDLFWTGVVVALMMRRGYKPMEAMEEEVEG